MSMSPRMEISGRKLWVYRGLTVALASLVGLYAAESVLRWRQGRIERSDALAPGMVQYDPDLGWRSTPGWSGRHQHHDFDATYSINALGFRNDGPVLLRSPSKRLTLVVGDSFTFGLGVGDDATFVHHLNASPAPGVAFANAAVPGYSTDQEMLLVEKRILSLAPERIVLAVYVGNDLFDNRRAFPMQVSSHKPYFEVTEQGLALRNSPVSLERKPRAPGPGGLVAAVWGPDPARWNWRTRFEQNSELFRVLAQAVIPESDYRAEFAERFAPELKLFDGLVQRLAEQCAQKKIRLTIVTLAGRSFVDSPGSVSAQYQDLFRAHVVDSARARQLPVIDVAGQMQARYRQQKAAWFFPHDGHLNPAGHLVVAEILKAELDRL